MADGTGIALVEELLGAAASTSPPAGRRSVTLMGRFAGRGPHALEAVNDLDVLFVYDPLDAGTLAGLRAALDAAGTRASGPGVGVATRFVNGPVKLPPEEGRTLFLYHVSIYTPATLRAESPLLLHTWLARHRTLAGAGLDALVSPAPLSPRQVLDERLGVRWALEAIRSRRVPFASWIPEGERAVCREDHLDLSDPERAELLCYAVAHAVENALLAQPAGGVPGGSPVTSRILAGPGAERLLHAVARGKERLRDPRDAAAVDLVLALEPAVVGFLEGLASWLAERAEGA